MPNQSLGYLAVNATLWLHGLLTQNTNRAPGKEIKFAIYHSSIFLPIVSSVFGLLCKFCQSSERIEDVPLRAHLYPHDPIQHQLLKRRNSVREAAQQNLVDLCPPRDKSSMTRFSVISNRLYCIEKTKRKSTPSDTR